MLMKNEVAVYLLAQNMYGDVFFYIHIVTFYCGSVVSLFLELVGEVSCIVL
jgi:hypothetical protein